MSGFKVIYGGRVYAARDAAEAGAFVARFYPEASRLRTNVSLTSDREPSLAENLSVADVAARTLAREGRI